MFKIKFKFAILLATTLLFKAAAQTEGLSTNTVAVTNANTATDTNTAAAAADDPIVAEINSVAMKVNAKLQAGKDTEADLADELKDFDALLAKHAGEKTDDVAAILLMKARLYLQVLNLPVRALETYKQLSRDFPDSKYKSEAMAVAAQLENIVTAEKINQSLTLGVKFPDFAEKDSQGRPLTLANYKGKVVLVDFWATWCPLCRIILPSIIETYGKFHGQGFEVVGVNYDTERATLDDFLKEQKDMTWPQFFDNETAELALKTGNHNVLFQNRLGTKYGVEKLPTTYLLDGDGKIIGKDLHGDELAAAVAAALAKK